MSQSKKDKTVVPPNFDNTFALLGDDTIGVIASHLSVAGVREFLYCSREMYGLFKPYLPSIKARDCVVQGDVKALKIVAEKDPEALFRKGDVTDADGCTFYEASAYQLIHFLCDADMKKSLLPLIPRQFKDLCQKQITELGRGGADLIKLDREPQEIASEDFTGFTQFKQTFTLFDETQHTLNFPLLENPDGIIYYQDLNKTIHFYYIHYATKELIALEPSFTSEEDKPLFEAFKHSFDVMEQNASRRSSNVEHQLIQRLFHRTLHREGIRYEHKGIQYCDSHAEFSLMNAYRTSIRLYDEAQQNNKWGEVGTYWISGVGQAQRKVMWLLQRLCQKNYPFYPRPTQFSEFNRDVTFWSWTDRGGVREESAVVSGKIIYALGSDFALYKAQGLSGEWGVWGRLGAAERGGGIETLVGVSLLIDDAKANIIEQTLEPESDFQPAGVR